MKKPKVLPGPRPAPDVGSVTPPAPGEKPSPEITREFALEEWEALALRPANENRQRARVLAEQAASEHRAAEEQFGDLLTKVVHRLKAKHGIDLADDSVRNFNFKKKAIVCALPKESK